MPHADGGECVRTASVAEPNAAPPRIVGRAARLAEIAVVHPRWLAAKLMDTVSPRTAAWLRRRTGAGASMPVSALPGADGPARPSLRLKPGEILGAFAEQFLVTLTWRLVAFDETWRNLRPTKWQRRPQAKTIEPVLPAASTRISSPSQAPL
jgi:hypothetical protein